MTARVAFACEPSVFGILPEFKHICINLTDRKYRYNYNYDYNMSVDIFTGGVTAAGIMGSVSLPTRRRMVEFQWFLMALSVLHCKGQIV